MGHEDSDESLEVYLEEVVENFNRRSPPSRLLFICPIQIEQNIKQIFLKRWSEFKGRLSSATHIIAVPYNERGELEQNNIISLKKSKEIWDVTDSFLDEINIKAVQKIFDENHTILYAPHGYVFKKISGQEQNIFVRAGNMLRDPNCLLVFNFLLLRRLPEDCSVVFIDSFTILSFALGLKSLVGHFHRLGKSITTISIVNIHSYRMNPEFRVPNEKNYLFIISATTSGGLAHKLESEYKADKDRIVHLLGVGPTTSDWRKSCVYFKEWKSDNSLNLPHSQQNTLIEINTEEFLISQSHPRPVSITRRHVNSDGAQELHKLYYKNSLKFNEPGPRIGGGYTPFSILTREEGIEPSPIRDWVKSDLIHELPASVTALIHADDSLSKSVALWIQDVLSSNLEIKSLSELQSDNNYLAPNNSSIVVIASFDPNLESLRECNIALRRMENVHRHYVLGYTFPISMLEHNRFKNDLRMGRSGLKYGWSEFMVLPVGPPAVHDSLSSDYIFFDENAIEENSSKLGSELKNALTTRNKHTTIPWNGLFFPRTNGAPLFLRRDSVFFPGKSVEGISQIAVHAMVSAAMQAAREPEYSSGSNTVQASLGFDENPFVRAVLDPDMFGRYNDGVIQAALLRSSQRSELDYSGSDDLSCRFMSVCNSVFNGHENDIGDAAFEFLFAIETGKVSLRKCDKLRLEQLIETIDVLSAFKSIISRK